MALNARSKGASGEREMADLLTIWASEIGVTIRPERNLEQVRHGGADLNGIPGMEVEVKRVERQSVRKWWDQVCKAAKKSGKTPMLAYRPNRKPWRFMVRQNVAIYTGADSCVAELVFEMDEANAKHWFQHYIWLHRGEIK